MKNLLLSILMMMPIMASADNSGSCGENLTWTYVEETKTLTISGSGPMTDYKTDYYAYDGYWTSTNPWGRDVQNLVIESGITHIGSGAFASCFGLTAVTIPNSVTSIGENAFYGCI